MEERGGAAFEPVGNLSLPCLPLLCKEVLLFVFKPLYFLFVKCISFLFPQRIRRDPLVTHLLNPAS